MNLKEFIEHHTSQLKEEAFAFAAESGILDYYIPDDIHRFVEGYANGRKLSETDYSKFFYQLEILDDVSPELHDAIVGIVHQISIDIFKSHEVEIKKLMEQVENNLNDESTNLFRPEDKFEKFLDLINVLRLTNGKTISLSRNQYGLEFPGVTPYIGGVIEYDVMFAINVLVLTNKLSKDNHYAGLNFNSPFYPTILKVAHEEKLPLQRGIKESEKYYPFKRVFKLAKGQTGDTTFVATNGKKLLYIRGIEKYSPHGILASKIATFISKDIFSSERLLDIKLAASKKVGKDIISVSDRKTRPDRKDYIENQKKVFPGTGIIDEVLNFVDEADGNMENYLFSSPDIKQSHLIKIDFDKCSLTTTLQKEQYEKDILSKPTDGMYHGLQHVFSDTQYIREKLSTRLKLSILSAPFLMALAEKAFIDPDQRNQAVMELNSRTNTALILFLENPHAKDFLIKNPNILDHIFTDAVVYVKKHFNENQCADILSSIKEKIDRVKEAISKLDFSSDVTASVEKKATAKIITPDSHEIAKDSLSRRPSVKFLASRFTQNPENSSRDPKRTYTTNQGFFQGNRAKEKSTLPNSSSKDFKKK